MSDDEIVAAARLLLEQRLSGASIDLCERIARDGFKKPAPWDLAAWEQYEGDRRAIANLCHLYQV